MATLNTAARKKIKLSNFAVPGRRAYPIENASHARNALARSSGKPEAAQVRAAVMRKYPNMGKAK